MVLIEQISALIDFLENHQDLALGYCSRTNEGRSLSKRYWMECAQILNSISVDCPNKTPAEWRTFYNEYKSKTLKKIKSQKSEISATGGGPAKKISLTPLQERLYSILGRDVGEPLPGVRHNPLTPSITLPVVPASPTTSTNFQFENNSFSILDNYEVPVTIVTDELGENVEISMEQENLGEPSTTDQPLGQPSTTDQPLGQPSTTDQPLGQPSTTDRPPKRRHRPARHYAAEDRDRDHTALEAAQSRLEAIEARNAEATLKQAQATNNLAAAIERLSSTTEKMVDLIGQLVTSVPKKKLRKILISSDSESD
ncbi:uncharacterized protein LOC123702179 [Colias croceus]|uniref:uncharacterized protein LOC123702179 n=1 Tax=Colias crocea TaxID=72248 RepID=UPI001E280F38|nr:uncharacterized protein LOC123702179 [Colias croceus]